MVVDCDIVFEFRAEAGVTNEIRPSRHCGAGPTGGSVGSVREWRRQLKGEDNEEQ